MRIDRLALWGGVLMLLSGCQSLLGRGDESAHWGQGMSSDMRAGFQRLLDMPYAMLYGNFSDQEEAAFILAEQNSASGLHHWIGSNGTHLWTQNGVLRATRGLLNDVQRSESVQTGAVQVFLRGEGDVIDPARVSVQWVETASTAQWVEQIGQVESVANVPYISFALNGRAWQVTERVRVTGEPGSFERVYWIEPTTRSLLRMRTQISGKEAPITLEWVRVPDRADLW